MKFWEAMKALEEGKKVRAVDWGDDEYITLRGEILVDEEGYTCTHTLEGEGINKKWEILNERKEVDPRFKEFYHYLKDENGFANGQYGDFIYERNEEDHLLAFYRQLLDMAKYYKLD